jgi:hypothetical protein
MSTQIAGHGPAESLNQKHVKVRCQWLVIKLPQHERDLTSMVGGMVHKVLHQVDQTDLSRTKREL